MRDRRDLVLGVLLIAAAILLIVPPIASGLIYPIIDVEVLRQRFARYEAPITLPVVSVKAAFILLLVWAGVVRIVLRRRGPLLVVLVDLVLTAPVTVFLIAGSNGVHDVLALVPLYALTTAAWLLVVLQPRVEVVRGHPLLPLCFAAGIGVVPWGVIALAQITGDAPGGVRIATIVALAGHAVVGVLLWRSARTGRAAGADVAAAIAIAVTAYAAVLLS